MDHDRTPILFTAVLALALILADHTAQVAAQDVAPSPLAAEAESLAAGLDRMREEYSKLEARLPSLSLEDSLVTMREMMELFLEGLDQMHELAGVIRHLDEEGMNTTELRQEVSTMLANVPDGLRQTGDDLRALLDDARGRARAAAPADLAAIERDVGRIDRRISLVFDATFRLLQILDDLDFDSQAVRARLTAALEERAKLTAGRLRLAAEHRSALQKQLKQNPGEAGLMQRAEAAELAVKNRVQTMESTMRLMNGLGMQTTEYRTTLVEVTGELARGLDDPKVMLNLATRWLERARDWMANRGSGILAEALVFVVIILAFRFLARVIRKAVTRSIDSSRLRPTRLLRDMIVNMTGNVVMFFGLLVALSQVGVSLGPLLAGVGVAGFIVGFALQDTLANFAAGMMILFYRPFDVGDVVEAGGVNGKVSHMSLVSTTILTFDNQSLIVPNGKIWGDVIRNVTAQKRRRVDMVFGISYGANIPRAESVLKSIIDEHDKVLDNPEPIIKLSELADSSVNFIVRPWVKTEDYWEVLWDVTREVKLRFDREGIGIPFPQRDVHIHDASAQRQEQPKKAEP